MALEGLTVHEARIYRWRFDYETLVVQNPALMKTLSTPIQVFDLSMLYEDYICSESQLNACINSNIS
jgi:hypothetical protein